MRDPGPPPVPLELDRLRALLTTLGWSVVDCGAGLAVGLPRQLAGVELDFQAEDAGLLLCLRAGAYPASERRERLLAQLNLWNRTQPTPKAVCLQDARGRGVVEAQVRISGAPGSDAVVCARLDAGLRAVERLFEALWNELEGLLNAPLRLPSIRRDKPPPHSQAEDGADPGSPSAAQPEAAPAAAGAEAAALDLARTILGARAGWALVDAPPSAPHGRQAGFTAHPPESQDGLRAQVQGGHLRVAFAEQRLPAGWPRREAYAAANELNRHLRATVWVPADEAELRLAGALSVPLNEGPGGVQELLAAVPVEAQTLAGFLSGAGCAPGALPDQPPPGELPDQPPPGEPGALPLLLSQAQLEAVMQEKALAIYRDSEGDLGAFIDHDRFQLRRVGAELSVIGRWHMSLREEQLDRLRRKLNALNDEYLCVTAYSTRVEDDRISVHTSVSIDHHQGVTQAQLSQQLHCAVTASREVFAELLNTFTD